MRRWWVVLVGALAVLAGSLAVPATAGAAAEQSGQRLTVAMATFADPADCADGECDALYLTAATGVLGAAKNKISVPGVVLVEVAPSAVFEDGLLFPIGEPLLRACTTNVTVVVRNLNAGHVSTPGAVPLGEFVEHEDGTFECAPSTGHVLDLDATLTGVGLVMTSISRGTFGNPWQHETNGAKQDVREATVSLTGTLDGAALGTAFSANLMRTTSRNLVVVHRAAVGPAVRGPIRVAAHATLIKVASGWAGDWTVDAVVMRDPSGEGKAYLGVSGAVGDQYCWADLEPSSVELADDLSAGVATGSGPLYCGEFGEEHGTVTVAATWVGVGDAWRFRRTGVFHDPEGSGTTRMAGIHRDAALTLAIDGETLPAGEGFLEALTIKSTAAEG